MTIIINIIIIQFSFFSGLGTRTAGFLWQMVRLHPRHWRMQWFVWREILTARLSVCYTVRSFTWWSTAIWMVQPTLTAQGLLLCSLLTVSRIIWETYKASLGCLKRVNWTNKQQSWWSCHGKVWEEVRKVFLKSSALQMRSEGWCPWWQRHHEEKAIRTSGYEQWTMNTVQI